MKAKLFIILRIIGFFIAYLFIAGLFQALASWLAGVPLWEEQQMTDGQFLATNFGGFLGTLIVLYIFTRWVDKIPLIDIGLQTDRLPKDFFKGLLLGFLPIATGFIILYSTGLIRNVSLHFDAVKLVFLFLTFVFVAFNEEAFLRGYVLRNLMLISNKYVALIISALLFAMMHLFNDYIDWIGFTNIFLAGILLGLSYIFTKNLWFPIGVHLAWNFAQSIFGFNVSGHKTYSLLQYDLSDKLTWLSGGKFGFEASALSLFFLVIMIGIVYVMFRKEEHS